MSRAGIDASGGILPTYVSGASVYRDATDAKNITYTVTPGFWAGNPTAWTYQFFKWAGGSPVLVQNSASPSLNVAGDPPADSPYRCDLYVANDNGLSSGKVYGYFGDAYPLANPTVWTG